MAFEARQDATGEKWGSWFSRTRWSVVLAAREGDSPGARSALEELCRTYWYPLYAYVRRRGFTHEDAEDLTQAFFAHLLRKDFLNRVAPERGRFRSFLLVCLNHFLADESQKARSAKRGGLLPVFQVDATWAEERYRREPCVEADAERLYERRWALDLLERVLDRLRTESVAAGRAALFEQLQGCLRGNLSPETHAELGARLGLSETAVKVAVHRLRLRLRELLREEIAHTVSHPDEVDEELRSLVEIVSR